MATLSDNAYRDNVVNWLDADDASLVRALMARLNVSSGDVVSLAINVLAKSIEDEEVANADEKQS